MFLLLALFHAISLIASYELVGTEVVLPTYKEWLHINQVRFQSNTINQSLPLNIQFSLRPSFHGDVELSWTVNGNRLTLVKNVTDALNTIENYPGYSYHDEMKEEGRDFTLHIKVPTINSIGPVNLTVSAAQLDSQLTATSWVQSVPIISRINKTKRGLEADRMIFFCQTHGQPAPVQVIWHRFNTTTTSTSSPPDQGSNSTGSAGMQEEKEVVLDAAKLGQLARIENDSRIQLDRRDVLDDKLVLHTLYFNDSGLFVCTAANRWGQDVYVFEVRVTDRLAALWPFLGIVVEVAVLVTVILVWERYRTRSSMAKAAAAGAGGGGAVTTSAAAAANNNAGKSGGTAGDKSDAGGGGEPAADPLLERTVSV